MHDDIRPCSPMPHGRARERRFLHHSLVTLRDLNRNCLLTTEVGFVSYMLADHLLLGSVDAAVASGVAALFIDPETGEHVYVYVDRS